MLRLKNESRPGARAAFGGVGGGIYAHVVDMYYISIG